jgi:hypothetical protein
MGMYDEIYVKQDLPLPEEIKNLFDWKNYRFQTKDLDNCLGEYIINEYNELVEVITEREYIPYTEKEKKELKPKPWSIWKEVIEKEKTYKNINYHGIIKFYTFDSLNEDNNFWVDFQAYFVYGKLDKIELLEFKIDSEGKKRNKEFFKEMERRKKEPWNLFKTYASYLGWSWFWRKLNKCLFKVSSFIDGVRTFIFRYML